MKTVTAQNGTTAELKQKGQNNYCLTIISRNAGHNRWGTLSEINRGIKIFIQTGHLPENRKEW